MLTYIKLSLRIYHNALDSDIQGNIDACMLDLRRVGVSEKIAASDSEDSLIRKAAELYIKWQYDFNGKGENFKKAYEDLREAISLCNSYIAGGGADV